MRPVDEIAVERAMSGQRVHLSRPERTVAIAYLTARGRSGREIAELLRLSERTVFRHRARLAAELSGSGSPQGTSAPVHRPSTGLSTGISAARLRAG